MADLIGHLVDAPLANILILAGIAFLAVGVLGKISGKIEPGNTGRVLSGLVGIALLVYGIYSHGQSDAAQAQSKQQATSPTPGNNTSTPASGGEHSQPNGEATQQAQQTSDECVKGFVWREAFPGDHVCVTPLVHENVVQQNQLALKRRAPNGGASGPDTCLEGFVWREARPSDHVCVPPRARDEAAADNAAASKRISH